MGLKIYSSASPSAAYSIAGTFTAPLTIVQDGKYGGVTQKLLYVRNDDAASFFTDTTLTPVDVADPTIVDGSQNITWKLSVGNTQPTDDEWTAITTGNTIDLADLGSSGSPNTSTYLPFWLRVEIPRNTEVQTILDVKLQIDTTQNAV